MKNLTLLLFATLLSITAMAQQPKKVYCAIWGSETTSFEGYVYIDYGQDDDRQNYLVNSEGKGIKYNSLVQAANIVDAASADKITFVFIISKRFKLIIAVF